MKKIQVIFPFAAFLFAAVGVFASAFAPSVVYYRPIDANHSVLVTECSVVISDPCPDQTGPQCTKLYKTFIGEEDPGTFRTYSISKRIDGGTCTLVKKNAL